MGEPVITPVGAGSLRRGGRSLDERIAVRWPRTWQAVARFIQLLPPRSRVRRVLLRHAALAGVAAFARWDIEFTLLLYAPDCRIEMPAQFVALGMRSVYEGHAGVRDLSADLRGAFDEMERRPREIIDAGDRVVALGSIHTRGGRSGVELDSPVGDVGWVERGLITRQCVFLDWDEARRAAGISTTLVRTPIAPDVHLHIRRTREEELMVRWPEAWAFMARTLQILPPGSRLRATLLRRSALSGWGAWVRGDLDLCLVRFAHDYEYDPPKEWLLPGMPTAYRGHAGLRQWASDLHDAWEILDHTPLELADAGSAFAFQCRVRLRGRASGIEIESHLGQVFWVRRGLLVRERDFGDWNEALRVLEGA